MKPLIDDGRPIFQQLAEYIEDETIAGTWQEEEQIPSTNQFASYYQINPATAGKAVNLLVDDDILYKKRGIGMFVRKGAKNKLIAKRKEQFYEQYVVTMIQEAKKLGMTLDQLVELVKRGEKEV